MVFRCYNDAIAFRYEVPKQAGMKRLTVTEEGTSFVPTGNPRAYVQYLENYRTSHEHNVTTTPCATSSRTHCWICPLTLAWEDGTYLAITEAALRHYAGMSLMRPANVKDSGELVCRLTPRPDGTKVVRDLPMADTLARGTGRGAGGGAAGVQHALLPERAERHWRYVMDQAGQADVLLVERQCGQRWQSRVRRSSAWRRRRRTLTFAPPTVIAFHSVICDNEDTPWYQQTQKGVVPGPDTDVTQVRADLDLAAIRQYAASKGVRLWTWVHQAALRGRVEEAFAAFERIGWSGMMVDFFDHDDQETVEFAEEILQAAARHHILIHFHGVWKPTGWQRTYPNLMNHEGALNLEYLKWSDRCTPEHTLNLLFTRMVAGPMDYHAGGFRAVTRAEFKPHLYRAQRAGNALSSVWHRMSASTIPIRWWRTIPPPTRDSPVSTSSKWFRPGGTRRAF